MRAATAVSSVYRAYALAFALGLAILGMGVGLAHAETGQPASSQQVAHPKLRRACCHRCRIIRSSAMPSPAAGAICATGAASIGRPLTDIHQPREFLSWIGM